MNRSTVMIADDHLMFAEPNSRYLALHYQVLPPVTNLDHVAPSLNRQTPDVLLLDISFGDRSSLPIVPGLIKSHPAMRIIMVTGHANARYVADALKAGASGYVVKDGGPAELLLAIETVLANRVYITPELRTVTAAPPAQQPLSARQHEVLRLLRRGLTEKAIARELTIAVSTVEKHVSEIRRRLGVGRTKRTVDWPSVVALQPTAGRGEKRRRKAG